MSKGVKTLFWILGIIITIGIGFLGFFVGKYLNGPQKETTPTPTQTVEKTQVSQTSTIAVSPTPTSFAIFTGKVISTDGLNLRDKPSTSGSIIASLPYNAKIVIDGEEGNYYHGSYNGKSGYVSKEFIEKTTEETITKKTYSSETWGFSIEYQTDWNISDEKILTEPYPALKVEFGGKVTLGVNYGMGFENSTTLSEKTVSFDGIDGNMTLIQDNEDATKIYLASVQKSDNNYFFVMFINDSEVVAASTLEQLISSWKWK